MAGVGFDAVSERRSIMSSLWPLESWGRRLKL
jgi:hypothetical protein